MSDFKWPSCEFCGKELEYIRPHTFDECDCAESVAAFKKSKDDVNEYKRKSKVDHFTKVIEFSPYRGKIEPVKGVNFAKIFLHANHLEVMISYDYDYWNGITHSDDCVRQAILMNKNWITVERCRINHYLDPDEELLEVVQLHYYGNSTYIRCKNGKEADWVWSEIKEWMIGKS